MSWQTGDLEEIADPVSAAELARRATPYHRVTDAGGTNIGTAIWREETQRWWSEDDRWQTRCRHTTYAKAEASVRRRRLAPTREEAGRLR